MEEKKISVVIPVYNVEQYVERTINSVRNQTYKNIEIIIVDDGTKDNSGVICDNIAKIDDRIKVFHKENGGISTARNFGIEKISGDYVLFLDSDDYISPNLISLLIDDCDSDVDIIICKMKKVYPKDKRQPWDRIKIRKPEIINSIDFRKILMTGNNIDFCIEGNKLYKTSILDGVRFDESLKHGEDLIFNYKIAEKANKIKYIPMPLFAYYQRKGSAVKSAFSKRRFGVIKKLIELSRETEKFNMELTNCIRTWTYFSCLESLFFMMRDKIIDKESYRFLTLTANECKNSLKKNKRAKIFRRLFAPLALFLIKLFIRKENKINNIVVS